MDPWSSRYIFWKQGKPAKIKGPGRSTKSVILSEGERQTLIYTKSIAEPQSKDPADPPNPSS
jgi:hypothetical protein